MLTLRSLSLQEPEIISLKVMQSVIGKLAVDSTLYQDWNSRRTAYYDPTKARFVCSLAPATTKGYLECLRENHYLA